MHCFFLCVDSKLVNSCSKFACDGGGNYYHKPVQGTYKLVARMLPFTTCVGFTQNVIEIMVEDKASEPPCFGVISLNKFSSGKSSFILLRFMRLPRESGHPCLLEMS